MSEEPLLYKDEKIRSLLFAKELDYSFPRTKVLIRVGREDLSLFICII